MANRSPYERTTSPHAYTVGRDFIAHLDHILAPQGGMRSFLKQYFETKSWSTVDAAEFQRMVEVFHGQSLNALFDEFVNNTQASSSASHDAEVNEPGHHTM